MREKKGRPSFENSMNGHFSARGIRPYFSHKKLFAGLRGIFECLGLSGLDNQAWLGLKNVD